MNLLTDPCIHKRRKTLSEARYSFSGLREGITNLGEEPVDPEGEHLLAPVAGSMESEAQMFTRLFSEAFRLEEKARSLGGSSFAPTSSGALEGAVKLSER